MTHEGRMQRGKENADKGILLDNADTLYYLEHKVAVEAPKEELKHKGRGRPKKEE